MALSSLERGSEGRRQILDRLGYAMLQQPALGAELVARMLASPLEAQETEEMADLLGWALESARMARENEQTRGDVLLSALEKALEQGERRGQLDYGQRLLFRSVWAGRELPLPRVLELTEEDVTEELLEPGNLSAEALIEQLFSELEEETGGDIELLQEALNQTLPSMPQDMRRFVVASTLQRSNPVYERLGIFWLLDLDPALRLAAAEGLAARLRGRGLTGETTAVLALLRSWLPEEAARALLDQILRDALRAGLSPAEEGRSWQIRRVMASLPDGAGAQSIAIALSSGPRRKLAMVLLKQQQGVKEAFVLPRASSRDQKQMLSQFEVETGAIEVSPAWLEPRLAMAIGEGLETGRPPAAGLIEIARLCGFENLHPQGRATGEMVEEMLALSGLSSLSSAERRRLIASSRQWPRRHGILQSWFEQSDAVQDLLNQGQSFKANEAELWRWLDSRRPYWARLMALSAQLLEAAEHVDALAFAATAAALHEGKSLKSIPIMQQIHEQTIMAWLAEQPNPELGDTFAEDSEEMLDGDSEEIVPQFLPEGRGELDRLLRGTGLSSDWIDGYLMAVILAPRRIAPQRWVSELLEQIVPQLAPESLERFLELVAFRANGAQEETDDPSLFDAAMARRDKKAMSAWAAGFSYNQQSHRANWPRSALANDDRAMLRLISDRQEGSFTQEEQRLLGQWIAARRTKNLQH